MGLLHISSGAAFALSWFLFIDGAIFAHRGGPAFEYQFVEWLPGVLNLVAMVLCGFVNIDAFKEGGGESAMMMGGGGDDEKRNVAARSVFFMAVCVSLAGLSIAVWMLSTRYSGAGGAWPGIALLLQCCGMMSSGGLLMAARAQDAPQESSMGF
jgi:hypothetical protein